MVNLSSAGAISTSAGFLFRCSSSNISEQLQLNTTFCSPMTIIFRHLFSLKMLGQPKPNFRWASVGRGTQVYIHGPCHMTKMAGTPQMVKTFENLFRTRSPIILTLRMQLKLYKAYMSLVVRKPVFGFSEQVRHKSGCTATEDG